MNKWYRFDEYGPFDKSELYISDGLLICKYNQYKYETWDEYERYPRKTCRGTIATYWTYRDKNDFINMGGLTHRISCPNHHPLDKCGHDIKIPYRKITINPPFFCRCNYVSSVVNDVDDVIIINSSEITD